MGVLSKCILADLAKLSPFSRSAEKKPLVHPGRKCRRYAKKPISPATQWM